MRKVKIVTRSTAAQQLVNEKIPLESRSPSRTPNQSPARRKDAVSPRIRPVSKNVAQSVDQMDFQNDDLQHTPPKQRKIDDFEVGLKKGRNLQLQFVSNVEDVHMEENYSSSSLPIIQQDLSDRITKMIVSQIGFRKRKYKSNKDNVSDVEMEDDYDSGPQSKRSLCEIDYAKLTTLMDHMDVEQMAKCIPKVKDYFEQWKRLLALKNYNILVTGKGSKMKIINKFIEQADLNLKILFVNGASLTTSTKSIFNMIEKELKIKMTLKRTMTPVEFAREFGAAIKKGKINILLVIHSLDGPNLRDPTQQSILANFTDAAKGKLNLIASADHVNHGLLWNNEVRCAYSFVPYTVDTFMSYKDEISESSPGLLGMKAKSAAESHTLASLEVFWQALPATAQKELFLLTIMSLENTDGTVELNSVFDRARRQMITTSRTSLEQHLTEFKDHSLISMNHGLIRLIIDRDLLLNFMNSKGMEMDD